MAWKPPDAGELRTIIRVTRKIQDKDEFGQPKTDPEGYPITREVNVFGPGGKRHVKWVGAWGSDVYTARQAGVTEPATLTMRYTPKVTTECLVYEGRDPCPYEVISVNDIEKRHAWLEVKVQRQVRAQ